MAHFAALVPGLVPLQTRFSISSLSPEVSQSPNNRLTVNFCQGHFGTEAAEYVATHADDTIRFINRILESPDTSNDEIQKASFKQIHEDMLMAWRKKGKQIPGSGTSLTRVSVTLQEELQITQLGGSTCYLVQLNEAGHASLRRLTEKHTLTKEEERKQISEKLVNTDFCIKKEQTAGAFKDKQKFAIFCKNANSEDAFNPRFTLTRTLGDIWSVNKDTGIRALSYSPDIKCGQLSESQNSFLLFITQNLKSYFKEEALFSVITETGGNMEILPNALLQRAEELADRNGRILLEELAALVIPLDKQMDLAEKLNFNQSPLGNRGARMMTLSSDTSAQVTQKFCLNFKSDEDGKTCVTLRKNNTVTQVKKIRTKARKHANPQLSERLKRLTKIEGNGPEKKRSSGVSLKSSQTPNQNSSTGKPPGKNTALGENNWIGMQDKEKTDISVHFVIWEEFSDKIYENDDFANSSLASYLEMLNKFGKLEERVPYLICLGPGALLCSEIPANAQSLELYFMVCSLANPEIEEEYRLFMISTNLARNTKVLRSLAKSLNGATKTIINKLCGQFLQQSENVEVPREPNLPSTSKKLLLDTQNSMKKMTDKPAQSVLDNHQNNLREISEPSKKVVEVSKRQAKLTNPHAKHAQSAVIKRVKAQQELPKRTAPFLRRKFPGNIKQTIEARTDTQTRVGTDKTQQPQPGPSSAAQNSSVAQSVEIVQNDGLKERTGNRSIPKSHKIKRLTAPSGVNSEQTKSLKARKCGSITPLKKNAATLKRSSAESSNVVINNEAVVRTSGGQTAEQPFLQIPELAFRGPLNAPFYSSYTKGIVTVTLETMQAYTKMLMDVGILDKPDAEKAESVCQSPAENGTRSNADTPDAQSLQPAEANHAPQNPNEPPNTQKSNDSSTTQTEVDTSSGSTVLSVEQPNSSGSILIGKHIASANASLEQQHSESNRSDDNHSKHPKMKTKVQSVSSNKNSTLSQKQGRRQGGVVPPSDKLPEFSMARRKKCNKKRALEQNSKSGSVGAKRSKLHPNLSSTSPSYAGQEAVAVQSTSSNTGTNWIGKPDGEEVETVTLATAQVAKKFESTADSQQIAEKEDVCQPPAVNETSSSADTLVAQNVQDTDADFALQISNEALTTSSPSVFPTTQTEVDYPRGSIILPVVQPNTSASARVGSDVKLSNGGIQVSSVSSKESSTSEEIQGGRNGHVAPPSQELPVFSRITTKRRALEQNFDCSFDAAKRCTFQRSLSSAVTSSAALETLAVQSNTSYAGTNCIGKPDAENVTLATTQSAKKLESPADSQQLAEKEDVGQPPVKNETSLSIDTLVAQFVQQADASYFPQNPSEAPATSNGSVFPTTQTEDDNSSGSTVLPVDQPNTSASVRVGSEVEPSNGGIQESSVSSNESSTSEQMQGGRHGDVAPPSEQLPEFSRSTTKKRALELYFDCSFDAAKRYTLQSSLSSAVTSSAGLEKLAVQTISSNTQIVCTGKPDGEQVDNDTLATAQNANQLEPTEDSEQIAEKEDVGQPPAENETSTDTFEGRSVHEAYANRVSEYPNEAPTTPNASVLPTTRKEDGNSSGSTILPVGQPITSASARVGNDVTPSNGSLELKPCESNMRENIYSIAKVSSVSSTESSTSEEMPVGRHGGVAPPSEELPDCGMTRKNKRKERALEQNSYCSFLRGKHSQQLTNLASTSASSTSPETVAVQSTSNNTGTNCIAKSDAENVETVSRSTALCEKILESTEDSQQIAEKEDVGQPHAENETSSITDTLVAQSVQEVETNHVLQNTSEATTTPSPSVFPTTQTEVDNSTSFTILQVDQPNTSASVRVGVKVAPSNEALEHKPNESNKRENIQSDYPKMNTKITSVSSKETSPSEEIQDGRHGGVAPPSVHLPELKRTTKKKRALEQYFYCSFDAAKCSTFETSVSSTLTSFAAPETVAVPSTSSNAGTNFTGKSDAEKVENVTLETAQNTKQESTEDSQQLAEPENACQQPAVNDTSSSTDTLVAQSVQEADTNRVPENPNEAPTTPKASVFPTTQTDDENSSSSTVLPVDQPNTSASARVGSEVEPSNAGIQESSVSSNESSTSEQMQGGRHGDVAPPSEQLPEFRRNTKKKRALEEYFDCSFDAAKRSTLQSSLLSTLTSFAAPETVAVQFTSNNTGTNCSDVEKVENVTLVTAHSAQQSESTDDSQQLREEEDAGLPPPSPAVSETSSSKDTLVAQSVQEADVRSASENPNEAPTTPNASVFPTTQTEDENSSGSTSLPVDQTTTSASARVGNEVEPSNGGIQLSSLSSNESSTSEQMQGGRRGDVAPPLEQLSELSRTTNKKRALEKNSDCSSDVAKRSKLQTGLPSTSGSSTSPEAVAVESTTISASTVSSQQMITPVTNGPESTFYRINLVIPMINFARRNNGRVNNRAMANNIVVPQNQRGQLIQRQRGQQNRNGNQVRHQNVNGMNQQPVLSRYNTRRKGNYREGELRDKHVLDGIVFK